MSGFPESPYQEAISVIRKLIANEPGALQLAKELLKNVPREPVTGKEKTCNLRDW